MARDVAYVDNIFLPVIVPVYTIVSRCFARSLHTTLQTTNHT